MYAADYRTKQPMRTNQVAIRLFNDTPGGLHAVMPYIVIRPKRDLWRGKINDLVNKISCEFMEASDFQLPTSISVSL